MGEFLGWEVLTTYGGAITMVAAITQFTKGLAFIDKLPTQIYTYILALIIMLCGLYFTTGLTTELIAQTLFNAIFVSLASNGAYHGVKSMLTSKKDTNNNIF